MSLDTTGVAEYCERLRDGERQRWRAECDAARARREGGGFPVAANISGGQGRGEGWHRGEGQGEGVGWSQGGQDLALLPDRSVVTYWSQGDGNLVSEFLKYF